MTEEDLFKHHMLDLANQSQRQSRFTYSAFLGLPEQDQFVRMDADLNGLPHKLYAPIELAERKIAVFGSAEEMGYEPTYPISIIEISPLAPKFAEELSHRDYLGAILNLGIERELIGDIVIKEKSAYVCCMDSITDFLLTSITRIKHTDVKATLSAFDIPALAPTLEEIRFNVASERIDSIVAVFCHLSRSKATELFSKERVFVNGKVITSLSYNLKENDVLTVRGFGKSIYDGIDGTSKKGRLYVKLRIYR